MSTRREFLKQSLGSVALGTLAAGVGHLAAAESESLLPIVDTHQHLWDLKVIQPPWLKPGGRTHTRLCDERLPRSHGRAQLPEGRLHGSGRGR